MLQKAEETQVVKIDTEIAEAFKIDIFKVQQMVKGYQTLTLEPEDEESYKICRTALTSCIRTRTGIDKRRLALNKDDQDRIKKRNEAGKVLIAIIEPAESHLSGLVKGEDNRIKAIEAEEAEKERKKRDKRFDDLFAIGVSMPIMEIAVLTDDEFQCLLDDKTFEFEEAEREKAEAEAAEKKRLAQEAADRKAESERLEKERVAQDAERERLEKIAADLAAADKVRQAELDAKQADLDAQTKALEDEKNRLAKAEADKKAAKEAEIQAAKDAEDLAKHQAKEAAEAEEKAKVKAERQEMLKPDKEKIENWFEQINKAINDYPKVNDEEAAQWVAAALLDMENYAAIVKSGMREL